MLELTNHVRSAGHYAEGAVRPGVPFVLRVVLGTRSVEWYADERLLYADNRGVGPHWRAWPVVGISVAAGRYGHLAPAPGTDELEWRCTGLTVRRPVSGTTPIAPAERSHE
jgi:hypothetical protein